jgi:catechol 2,3-dioxygenase-like lactoylglutathione lyase family enzyme
MDLDGLDHVALTVSDVARSIAWYSEVLNLRQLHAGEWGNRPAMLVAGGTGLALFELQSGETMDPGTPGRFRHVAFGTSRTGFQNAQNELRQRDIDFEYEDHRVSWSIYVSDPDGYRVEITTYEPA